MNLTTRMPSIFLSHGSPLMAVQDSPAGRFLDALGDAFPRPRAIVVASAHFIGEQPAVGAAALPATVHDFGGFPAQLYDIAYPASGEPRLAEAIARRLADAGLQPQLLPNHGLDHGVWVPLRRMYPQADIPVVPLSVNPGGNAAHHFNVGRALASFRDEGVLVVGSGGFVHNLGELDWRQPDAPMPAWASEFAAWMCERLARNDTAALLDWERQAPHPRRAHPTVEHLMPLFVALGAGGETPTAGSLHRSNEFGSLALDAFAFE